VFNVPNEVSTIKISVVRNIDEKCKEVMFSRCLFVMFPPKDMTLSVDGCCMSDRLSVYGADPKSRTEGRRKLRTDRNEG